MLTQTLDLRSVSAGQAAERRRRIDSIRKHIQTGRYRIDAAALADSILARAVIDAAATRERRATLRLWVV